MVPCVGCGGVEQSLAKAKATCFGMNGHAPHVEASIVEPCAHGADHAALPLRDPNGTFCQALPHAGGIQDSGLVAPWRVLGPERAERGQQQFMDRFGVTGVRAPQRRGLHIHATTATSPATSTS